MNAMPHGSLCWADLMPADQDRAIGFYSELLGWTIEKGGEQLRGYSMAHLGAPSPAAAVAGIFAPMGGPVPPAWTLYLSTADIDATLVSVSEHGGAVVLPAHDVPGSGRFALATEPTGALFGLWQETGFTGFGVFGEPGAFCWAEFYTPDAVATGAFFTAVLGLEARPMAGPPGFTYLQMAVPANPEGRQIQFGVMQTGDGTPLPAGMPPMARGTWPSTTSTRTSSGRRTRRRGAVAADGLGVRPDGNHRRHRGRSAHADRPVEGLRGLRPRPGAGSQSSSAAPETASMTPSA